MWRSSITFKSGDSSILLEVWRPGIWAGCILPVALCILLKRRSINLVTTIIVIEKGVIILHSDSAYQNFRFHLRGRGKYHYRVAGIFVSAGQSPCPVPCLVVGFSRTAVQEWLPKCLRKLSPSNFLLEEYLGNVLHSCLLSPPGEVIRDELMRKPE